VPDAGTILPGGAGQTLAAGFIPADTTQFLPFIATTVINVTPAPLAVVVNYSSRSYGQANPNFTLSYFGFVLGQGPGVLYGAPVFSTAATPASDVGGYSVSVGGLFSPNYQITYVAGGLSVNPAVLTFTADDKARFYGTANPPFTYSVSGLVLGQAPRNVVRGAPVLGSAARPSSPPGTYAIAIGNGTLRLINPNYRLAFVNGFLQVVPRPVK
jgi:hypothetical protein